MTLLKEHPTNTILKNDSNEHEFAYQNLIPEPRDGLTMIMEKMILDSPPPKSFEGKRIWKKYLSNIYDQGICGSCWAFASVGALSDRFNIQSLGKIHVNLSPVRLVICDTNGLEENSIQPSPLSDPTTASNQMQKIVDHYGCGGNTVAEAWRFLYVIGTNEISCLPLDILTRATRLPSCIKITGPTYDMCNDYYFNYNNGVQYGTPAKFYSANRIYSVAGTKKHNGSELYIRSDIYKFGPVSTAMILYDDFYTSFDPVRGGIYKWDGKSKKISGHAVIIDGWGEQNGILFWWVRNSWGKQWGINGYFKIVRGTNECMIEENVVCGLPDFGYNPNLDNIKCPIMHKNMDIIQKLPKDVYTKFKVRSATDFVGGITERELYSRRILAYKKYYPLLTSGRDDMHSIDQIDPMTFFAGKVTSSEVQKHSTSEVQKHSILIIVIILIILLVITLIILLK